MTTIAYKNGVIATDSQETCDGTILSTTCEKAHRDAFGRVFFLAGSIPTLEEFLKAWPNGEVREGVDAEGFVIDGGRLFMTAVWNEKVWTVPHDLSKLWACGSGWHLAIGAMDAGAGAKQAVEIAAERDTRTGLPVRSYDARTGERLD